MEQKGPIEKDKIGRSWTLVALNRNDVIALKEFANKYWQDDPNNKEDLTGQAEKLYNQLHEIWKQMPPT